MSGTLAWKEQWRKIKEEDSRNPERVLETRVAQNLRTVNRFNKNINNRVIEQEISLQQLFCIPKQEHFKS